MTNSCQPYLKYDSLSLHLTIIFKGVENLLKIQRIRAYNFKGKGIETMKVCHMTCRKVGMITFGGPNPKNFEKQKM